MNKQNVCFLCGDITGTGGTEKIISIITNRLLEVQEFNIFILSIERKNKGPFFEFNNKIKIDYIKRNNKINHKINYLLNIPKIRKYIKKNKINIIVDVDLICDLLTIPAKIGLKTKLISWENFNIEEENKYFRRRLAIKIAAKFSDYIITLTEIDKNNYIKQLKRKKNIICISNPTEKKTYEKNINKKKQIISVGKLLPIKGYDLLLQVAKIVLPKHKDWKWIILGDGPEEKYIRTEIKNANLQDQMLLLGSVKDVDNFYEESSIFVLTSKNEGFGIVILEAKEHKLPIVCFDIETGARELIRNNINGNLVKKYDVEEMAEKINRLIENPDIRTDYSEKSKFDLEKYDIDIIIEKWKHVLYHIINRR